MPVTVIKCKQCDDARFSRNVDFCETHAPKKKPENIPPNVTTCELCPSPAQSPFVLCYPCRTRESNEYAERQRRADLKREQAKTEGCWCYECNPGRPPMRQRMIVCPVCGNKRCPFATDHLNPCSGSNEDGQEGSMYHPEYKRRQPEEERRRGEVICEIAYVWELWESLQGGHFLERYSLEKRAQELWREIEPEQPADTHDHACEVCGAVNACSGSRENCIARFCGHECMVKWIDSTREPQPAPVPPLVPGECAIVGCGGDTKMERENALFPYCENHHSPALNDEWGFCFFVGCWNWRPYMRSYCSLHGGEDYQPRRREGEG